MGIKLRNAVRSGWIKTLVFIMFTASIVTGFLMLFYMDLLNLNEESLVVPEYVQSSVFINSDMYSYFDTVLMQIRSGEKPAQEDVYYYYKDDTKTVTNLKSANTAFFAQQYRSFHLKGTQIWMDGNAIDPVDVGYYYESDDAYDYYLAFSYDFIQEKQGAWEQERQLLMQPAIVMLVSIVLAIMNLVVLAITAGRRPEDDRVHHHVPDRIFTDILLGISLLSGMLWILCVSEVYNWHNGYRTTLSDDQLTFTMVGIGLITAVETLFCSWILVSFIRKFKDKTLFKHSLTYTCIHTVVDFFRSLFDGRRYARYPLTKRLFYSQAWFISLSFVMVFMTFVFLIAPPLMLLPPMAEIALIVFYIRGNNKTFEEINRGFNESLEDQMKAERMKLALVTNVSHDLKTPLTSIISYVDLLSQEEISETARDYVRILAEKSDRLKHIVADLFDLAKSTSGDMQVDMEALDLKKLVEQTLASMEDQIEQAGHHMKVRLPEESVEIHSDGKKLYRVFQNIIDNALKYAMTGTRVFVEMVHEDGQITVAVKNTAGYEMDFTAEEILQRFSRGDKSRSTEGSGLGLSIAESFTRVCGGMMGVDVDGDLFKVTLKFNSLK